MVFCQRPIGAGQKGVDAGFTEGHKHTLTHGGVGVLHRSVV